MKITHNDARICGDNEIYKRISDLRQKAVELARDSQILNQNMDITINYYPDYPPMFGPTGPIPIPKTFQECLASSFEPCVVSVVVRDKTEN